MGDGIAKAIILNAGSIIDAIDRYLAKADDGLEEELRAEGFAEAGETVRAVNRLEGQVADALHGQAERMAYALHDSEDGDESDGRGIPIAMGALIAEGSLSAAITEAASAMYEEQVPKLATVYMQESDGGLVVDTLRKRTSSWIQGWSEELGRLTQISTHRQVTGLVEDVIGAGAGIDTLARRIQEGGWRNEYYQARRLALTEVLRAHSVAREEAIQQSPSATHKEWKHTGGHKNEPRPNHVAMDGQKVPKAEPFVLRGRDGNTYHPMYPRDPILPASESVNCHCIHRPIASEEMLGMALEERKVLQQEIIDADDGQWKKELDAKNKAKAGITVDEGESSKVKYDNSAAVIDRRLIASAEYRNKYNSLPETRKIQRKVSSSAKKMLRHRSGTDYEDLAFINSRTGEVMTRDDYDVKKQVAPTRAMKKMIRDADDYTIIAVHNHPTSSVPSLDDLCSARDKKYKYGIVACHDGGIYKYHVKVGLNVPMADGGLDLLERVKYINDREMQEQLINKAFVILSESGVEMEVL